MPAIARPPKTIVYPDSDGMPMAENTLQFLWIVTIQGGLDALFAGDPNVFVAGDLFWYPVEGDPTIRQAPDILAAFGRPKGYRGSYRQWEEGGIAPQVVWEILSPGNRAGEMARKFEFYEKYGVEEYYVYDPDNRELLGWRRQADRLTRVDNLQGWISPRMGVRFEIEKGELEIYRPDGKTFVTYLELAAKAEQAERDKQQAERDKERAEHDKQQAQTEAERLRAQLRSLGIEPEA